MNTQKSLNPEQKKAVEHTDGPLLIIAGAGTGKTTVVAEKIAHIVNNNLAQTSEILAITFTDKAAGEMEERVDELLQTSYLDIHISTFHNFCKRLLENWALDIGISNSFKLLTTTEAWLLVRENFEAFDLDYYRPMGNPTRHIHELISHFQKCKDELITPEAYLEYAQTVKLDSDEVNKDEKSRLTELANAYHTYNQLLLDNNAMDFADLIYYSVQLLEKRPALREKIQQQFRYVLVDEFQDVNWSQYRLVQLLSQKAQLTVVGDDDQSIYAFRGASVSNILRFKQDYQDAIEVVLSKNYRSYQSILDAAYTLVQQNNPDRLEPKLHINKKLVSQVQSESKDAAMHLHFSTLDDEVRGVISEIVRLKEEEKCTWDDIAILVRANSHAAPFIHMLQKAGIPYEFLSASGLFKQPVVLDCLAFFGVVQAYKEQTSWYRLLRMPCVSFAESDMQKVLAFSKKKSMAYYEVLKRSQEIGLSQEGILTANKLINLAHEGLKTSRIEKPTTLLYSFLEHSGYFSYLTNEEEKGNREVTRQIYQLKQFFEFVSSYEQTTSDPNVFEFMQNYQHILESGDEGQLYVPEDTPESVNIMTVHGSKGLEYRYVFIVNCVEERFPTRRRSSGIEIPESLIKEQLPEGEEHYQEERRLMYVAMTRAKERLYLCSADNYGGVRKKKVSRFVVESGMSDDQQVQEKIQKNVLQNLQVEKHPSDEIGKAYEYTLPKVFSFSQIKAYETCPYQYKLMHVLKIPTKGSASFSFGSSMHNTLHAFYKQIQQLNSAQQASLFGPLVQSSSDGEVQVPGFRELLDMYEKNWISDWYKSPSQREGYYQKGKEILKTFYESQQGQWDIPVGLESWFKIQVGDHLLHGRIDRLDKLDDGSLEIIDYKTGKTKEKLAWDDKEQLLIYQIAAQTLPEFRNEGQVSKLTFYYLNDNVKTSFIGEEKDLEKLKTKLSGVLDAIGTRDFTPKPGPFTCGYCDYKEICEYREI
ncbi:ATP-dependent helicase [Candidatus Nomurabacteria bacterium]|nr:ATP-dependent helicase [Candidatus Nomurabacteria bacterium]